MKIITTLFVICTIALLSVAKCASSSSQLRITPPSVILTSVDFDLTLTLPVLRNGTVYPESLAYSIYYYSESKIIPNYVARNVSFSTLDALGNYQSNVSSIVAKLQLPSSGSYILYASVNAPNIKSSQTASVFVTPGLISLLPPLVTLVISSVLSNVLIALLVGLWAGASIVSSGNIITGFFNVFDKYWVSSFINDGHAGVLVFTLLLGGAIGVVQKGGGGQGLANVFVTHLMTSRLKTQLATWALSVCIFFDDFSSILIVGNSLRSVLSRTGVSREKFAIIIHSVGVCLPSMAPISSWIGVEIGYVSAQLTALKITSDPFMTVLWTIPYRLFPILLVTFIFLSIIFERDYGSALLQCERSAIKGNSIQEDIDDDNDTQANSSLDPKVGTPLRWYNAVLPFAVIVIATFVGMIVDGYSRTTTGDDASLLNALSHSDSVSALIKSSSVGCVVAFSLVLYQKLLSLSEAVEAWVLGIQDIIEPTIVLLLAWGLGQVIDEIQTAQYLSSVIVPTGLRPEILPVVATILAYVVSFATGSGFGTMAIMFPIISPLAFKLSNGNVENLLQCFGGIFGGSTFGNTCSPIADTSILTSLSARIPLTSHVSTILPYSLTVGLVSVFGTAVIGFNVLGLFSTFVCCITVLISILLYFGKNVEAESRTRFSSTFAENQSLL